MDKKEYQCKSCDKGFNHGYTRNRHEKVCIFYFYQGKCLKGRGRIELGGKGRGLPQGDSSLNPLTLQGKLCRGSGPLTPWGTGVHLSPGGLDPQPLVK